MTASYVIVENSASAEFTARDAVRVVEEFHASFGSETHIYCEEATFDCSELNNFIHQNRMADPEAEGEQVGENQIEVMFKKRPDLISVHPNPSTGRFTIEFNESEDGTSDRCIEVYDILGRSISSVSTTEGKFILDLSREVEGMYLLKVTEGESVLLNQRIILQ